jgi:hypothetical protein
VIDNPFSLKNIEPTGQAPATGNPFALATIERDQQQDLRFKLNDAVRTSADDASEAARLAKRYPAPEDVLLRNLRDVRLQEAVDKADEHLKTSPKLAEYMRTGGTFARQVHDHIPELSALEQTFNVVRALPAGAVTGVGTLVSGLGVGVDVAARATGLTAVSKAVRDLTGADLGLALDVAGGLKTVGGGWKMLGDVIGPAPENKNFATDVAGGIGQLLQQVGLQIATGGTASLVSLFAQGADVMNEKVKGDNSSQALKDTAVIAGASITALTEKYGVDALLNRVPPAIKNNALRWVADKFAAAGIEATQEVTEGVLQDVVRKMLTNDEAKIGEGVGYEASVAGTSAAIVRAALGVRVRSNVEIQRGVEAEQSAERIKGQMALASQALLRERNPEEFRALVQSMAEGTDGAPTEVYVDAEVLNQLAPEVLAQLPGVAAQMAAALAANDVVAIPMGDVLTVAPGTPLEAMLVEHARIGDVRAMSQFEAKEAGAKAQEFLAQESERVIAQAVDQQAWQASHDAVEQTVLDQLNAVGRFRKDVNEGSATMFAAMYKTIAGELGITPEQAWAQDPIVFTDKTGKGAVLNAGKTGEITVEGFHFSKADRSFVSTSMYGTGLQGSNREAFKNAKDKRLAKRGYFYADTGTGINPEAGVGGRGHKATLTNVYDSNTDPLRLKGGSQEDFESKVLDAGFSGYLDRLSGSQSGQVIMLGDQDIPVEQLGGLGKTTGQRVAPAGTREAKGRDAVVDALNANTALPAGSPTLARWQQLLAKSPEVLQALTDAGVFAGDQTANVYKSELIKRFIQATPSESYAQSLSSRLPSAVKATEDPLANVLNITFDVVLSDTKTLEKNVTALQALPNTRKLTGKGAKDPVKNVEAFIEHVTNNLLWLHDHMPAEMRDRARQWYDGGRKTVEAWANRYGISEMQGAAAIAVLSPQNGWFANVSQAERIADMVFGLRNHTWDDAMSAEADRLVAGAYATAEKTAAKEAKNLKSKNEEVRLKAEKKVNAARASAEANERNMVPARGKTLGELLATPESAARWVRVYDQTHNNRAYRVLTPEGGAAGYVQKGEDGEEGSGDATMMWKSYSTIGKAISVLLDGRAENVYYNLGKEHKVRNFYNNIFAPNSDLGYATIDTHAVAAALLRPLASADIEVVQAFGGGGSASSNMTGLNGTYPIYLEAYRRAAEARGILPREMQSITWEAVRGLFEAAKKSGMKAPANAIWARYKSGELDQEQAQKEILALAGDITPPSWTKVPHNDTPSRTYEGPAQKAVDAKGDIGAAETPSAKVMFEVAPDPNDAALTAEWNALDSAERLALSQQVAARIVPQVLKELGTDGDFVMQLGGYMGATNPSMTLRLARPELALTAAKMLGHALAQDSMMVVTERQTLGADPVGVVTVTLPEGYGETEISALYDKLWELEQDSQKLIGGHTTADGQMVILNYSGLEDAELARLVDEQLGGEFPVAIDTVYSAFPGKEDYGYGSNGQEGTTPTGQSPAQRRPSGFRAEATQLLREALDARRASGETYAQEGVSQPLLAPNGKPSNLTPAQHALVRTPEFKTWFGDWEAFTSVEGGVWSDTAGSVSKAVDENGEPLVVYHGTDIGGFTEFKTPGGKNRGDLGIFLTPNRQMARSYVKRNRGGENFTPEDMTGDPFQNGSKSGIYPLFVNIRSPNEANFEGANWDGSRVEQFEIFDENGDNLYSPEGKGFFTESERDAELDRLNAEDISARAEPAGDHYESTDSVVRDARKANNDGAIIRQVMDDGGGNSGYAGEPSDVFVAFDPTQLKSVDNFGTFDPADPNILKQGPRGTFNPKSFELALNPDANLSTVHHEMAHAYLEILTRIAARPNPPDGLMANLDRFLKWQGIADLDTWNAMTLDQKRPHHEALAEGYEQYLLTGKAPSLELQPLMRKLKAFMLNVYKSLKAFVAQRSAAPAGGDALGQTDNFAEWFGDSKVVDARGKPRVVYHGSPKAGFDTFGTSNVGVFFSSRNDVAASYAGSYDDVESDSEEMPGVYNVYLKLNNPMVIDWNGKDWGDGPEGLKLDDWANRAKSAGHDGLIVEDVNDTGWLAPGLVDDNGNGTVYVAFDSNQIKSTDNANPTDSPNIYGQNNEPSNLKLPPEMVQFYDRMLASEEQIAQAEEVAGLLPNEDATAEAVEKLTARSLRDLKWTVNARNKEIKKLQDQAKELRKGVEAEVRAEVDAMPEFQAKAALDKLRESTPEFKDALKDWNGRRGAALERATEALKAELLAANPEVKGLQKGQLLAKNKRDMANQAEAQALAWEKENPKPQKPIPADNDLQMATIADSFNYPDVPTMLQAIDVAGKKADAIEGMTDQRMLERHGDLIDQRAIEAAANEAVHNEARARSLATELRSQAEMLNPRADTGEVNAKGSKITVNAIVEAAKQFAANVVARTPLRDLKAKAWQHTAAERRAGKRWQEATAAGKTQDAVKAKQDQVLNNAAAKAALEAQGEMRKILTFFKRVIKDNNEKTVEKGRDPDVVNAARAVLGAYGIAPRGAKTAAEYMDLVAKNDPAMYAALQPSVQGALNMAQPLDALTMEELRGLHEEIQAMWHLAKRSRQMEIDGNLMDMQDAEDELQDRMQAIGVPLTMPGDSSAVTPREALARKLQHVGSLLRRTEQWAQGMGQEFTRLVFQPVKDAANAYRADRVAYRKKYQALVDNVAPALTKGTIDAPELGYTFGKGHNGIGHAELLHAILHTGNASNKRKLLLGRGWAAENADGTMDTTQWDAFLQRMHDTGVLNKAHYDFAQGVWDLLEQTKPLAQKTHRDVFGRYFAEVTADSFDTPFGGYAGGYVPAQADPSIVQDADLRKLAEAENENMAFSFPGTNKGFTKGRVDYNRPLMLDLRTIGQHIDKVLLFSHMEPAVRDVQKLLSRKGVSYSLGRIDPTIYAGMLTPWLNRSARQIVETPIVGDGGISRVLSAARNRAGMALMFANVSNTIQQLTGFSLAALKVKPASMMRATSQFIASPKKTAKAVSDASEFMANRMDNEIAAINDAMDQILLDPSLYEKAQTWSQKHAYFMQTAMANTMEPIIWTAAYNDALTSLPALVTTGLTSDQVKAAMAERERDAVRAADSVIRTTQGSTLPEDVSRIETGPAYARIFTQFIGYFNMMANTNATALKQISQEVGLKKGAGKAIGVVTLGFLIPIWVAEAIAHAMRGGPDDEDDDGYLDDWLAAVFGMGTIKGSLAMVPFVGQLANAGINRFNGNPADDKVSLSPAVSLLESAVGVPVDVYKAITDPDKLNTRNAVRDVASAVSLATGLPAVAVARPLGYLAGVATDKIDPTSAFDALRGTVTGTPSPDSK